MPPADRFIDGTVSFLDRDAIEIDFGDGLVVRIDASRVPRELHRFGQPIRATVGGDGSVAYSARLPRPVAPLPGEAEIDAWIEGL